MKKQTLSRKLRHQLNYEPDYQSFEHPIGISMTVPDPTPDLRSLIQRRDNGIPIYVSKEGYSEDDYPDLHLMQDVEIMQMRMENAKHLEELLEEQHDLAKEAERRKDAELLKMKEEAEKLRKEQIEQLAAQKQ